MSASNMVRCPSAHKRLKRLAKPPAVLWLALAVFAVALAGLTPCLAQAAEYDPFVMVLIPERDGKPNQQIVRYEVKPDAARYLVDGGSYIDATGFEKLRAAAQANDQSRLQALALEEGWGWYALSAGWVGSAATFAEHAVGFTSLANANNALTNIGGVLTVLQIGIDLAKGDNRQAGVDAFKGVTGFALSKYGSSALQLGGVAFFIFDQTLTTFGTAAWAAREEAWRHVYRRYYAEREAALRGTVTQERNLVDRFRAIRSRADAGRSLNDWKVVAAFYFKNASSPAKFQDYLDADIKMYVSKFWNSPDFLEYSADGGWSTAGFARASSLTEAIKDKLEREHADAVRAMLIKQVLPEIQRRAVEETLEAEALRLSGDWAKSQNETVTVEVSAFHIKGPTRFEMLKPSGGSWSGTIAPGQPRQLKITKIAMTLAGFPDTIVLDGPNGREQQSFKIVDGKASVVFGAPDTPTVSEFSRQESEMSCVPVVVGDQSGLVVGLDGEVLGQGPQMRPAPPSTPVHMGVKADGTMVLGQFSAAGGWRIASPGAYSEAGMSFGAPYFENIDGLDSCSLARKDHDFFGTFAEQKCTVTRAISETGADGAVRELRCTSQMTLSLTGIFAPLNGVMTYNALDPKVFGELQKGYEGAMEQMKTLPGGGGMQITDLNQILGGP